MVQTVHYGAETTEAKLITAIKTRTGLDDVERGKELFVTYALKSNWLGRINFRQKPILSESNYSREAANVAHSAMVRLIAGENDPQSK
jgi:hypothetical protein